MKSDISRIEAKINEAVEKYCMLDGTQLVIVGVSGGADSMALLSFLKKTFNNELNIIAAHVNHCLRAEESDRDETFVKEYCKKNAIKLEVLRIDVKKTAEAMRLGIEECARILRYRFFNYLARKHNGKIATAHTLSDSIETLFINLARGTGPNGLCGIAPVRETIIRPLILLKREETQIYCRENGINYVTDSTNFTRDYTRNKIRLDVLPLLKQINPKFEDVTARTISLLKADEEYLKDLASKFLSENLVSPGTYILTKVKTQPIPILSRFIRLAISEFLKSNVTVHHINLILTLIANDYGAVNLPKGITVCVKNDLLIVKKREEKTKLVKNNVVIPFKMGTLLTENPKKVIIKVLSKEEFEKCNEFSKFPVFYALDYDTISNDAVFRTRRAGDKFCKADRGVTKTVKKLFNELKVPQDERDNRLMLVADGNKVLWIDNIGIAECVKITEDTQKIAVIYYAKEDS